MLKKRVAERQANGRSTIVPDDPSFAKKWPGIWEWLTLDKFEDGSPRLLGKISVKTQDGLFLVTLSDEDSSACAFVSGATFEAALRSAEKAMNSEETRWVAYARKTAQKRS